MVVNIILFEQMNILISNKLFFVNLNVIHTDDMEAWNTFLTKIKVNGLFIQPRIKKDKGDFKCLNKQTKAIT